MRRTPGAVSPAPCLRPGRTTKISAVRGEEGERGTRAGLVVLPLGARSEARRSRPCRGACLVHEEASPTWRGEERPTCRAPHESLRGVSPAGLRLWKGQERA
ncbi:unnamed protein product [Prorocentrum cordatum]|uniref:Uncharacterized protein n=1 Tax=Prorocentrum cordatum TaxID=2364126 RepID=A0ABN9V5B4_9DINO|nr:unnamed protein product [Polarella glacialis]